MQTNKKAAVSFFTLVGAFFVAVWITIQSAIPGCAPPSGPFTAEAPPEAITCTDTTEISEAEYGKLAEMVNEYPEIARLTTKALWEDFKIGKDEYCDIRQEWKKIAQTSGHNKRKLLAALIQADPEPWESENAGGIKAQVRALIPTTEPPSSESDN